ncbi:MAG: PD-(D/E)XK nuclease family protein [Oscillospiraceae bacterium]|nr:PD-(D/E)XK nuclease family protein [Oscillospiraceae bacterium]
MLELIIGTDRTANTDELLRRLTEDVRQKKKGRILLIPELISHDMERRLSAAAGDTASRYAEVLSFTRLVRRVAEWTEQGLPACLDNGGRLVAMAAAARQLHSRLKAYASVETKPEFLNQMVDAVDEFKRCCITAEDLKKASTRAEGILAQKLEELSLLLETYDALCQRGKRDPRDQMNWVLEQLEDCDFAANHRFYIDGFPDYTRQHLMVLEHMIRFSQDVTVSVECDRIDSTLLAFEKAGATAAELVKCARRAGVEVKITTIPDKRPVLQAMRQGLFQGTLQPDSAVRVRQAESVHQECMELAADIRSLVRHGCRYRDIGVVCGNMADYRSVMSLIFRRQGIPVYLSGTEEVLSKGAVTTVLSALEAALDGYEQKAMLRYLSSPLSPMNPDTYDLVENYAVIWNITGQKWNQPWTEHPDGLSGKWGSHAQRRLQWLEDARIKAVEPLQRLQKRFQSAAKLADQVTAVYGFLEDIHLARRLNKLAETSEQRTAQILNQLWEILMCALEQLYDTLGETVWDTDSFRRLFTLLLSQYDVGTIPTVLDSVTVGPVSAMRCQRQKHLFVLGAEEGSLPGYNGSRGLLTDQERVALRKLEVPLTGGAMEGIQASFAEVYGVFCGAEETVTVSCGSSQPSFVYRRLKDMAGGELPLRKEYTTADAFDAACYLTRWGQREAAVALGLAEQYNQAAERKSHTLGTISRPNVDALYGDHLVLSASQVDRQAECRLSYFLKYGIAARERKTATVDPAEFGTFVHHVLEHTVQDIMAQGGFHGVSMEETMAVAKKHTDEYAQTHFASLGSERAAYLLNRNIQELEMVVRELWEELSQSLFQPLDVELHFGADGDLPAIQIPAGAMKAELQGFVDRVDGYQTGGVSFFRIVDYKTGEKDFDYCDVINGVGLQMLLYLFALRQQGQKLIGSRPVPAGVQYFPARAPYLSLDGALSDDKKKRADNWKRRGLLLDDDISIAAMDPLEGMPRLNCKRTKDGTLNGKIATREQMRQLEQYVFQVLGRIVDDIASGDVAPNPYTRGDSHDACKYCLYGAVCHKDFVEGRRNYKTVSADDFWNQIHREVNGHG